MNLEFNGCQRTNPLLRLVNPLGGQHLLILVMGRVHPYLECTCYQRHS
jgi:hypothetical protein